MTIPFQLGRLGGCLICVTSFYGLVTNSCQAQLSRCTPSTEVTSSPTLVRGQDDAEDEDARWRELFDGKSLEGWESAEFGGEGPVEVKDGEIVMGMGVSLTGVTFKGEIPKTNYEIELQAKQVEGIDFFCGLTFPVDESHCTFIVGGWAGSIVGLSSIDGMDASENDTTKIMYFDTDKWYRVRVRVEDDRIQCWLDDEQVVDQSIVDRELSIRPEVALSRPLGISSWQTTAALKDIRIRELQQDK